jgi:hypothetical protein
MFKSVFNKGIKGTNNKNYGIYANGLLVETDSERYLKNRSKMELIE